MRCWPTELFGWYADITFSQHNLKYKCQRHLFFCRSRLVQMTCIFQRFIEANSSMEKKNKSATFCLHVYKMLCNSLQCFAYQTTKISKNNTVATSEKMSRLFNPVLKNCQKIIKKRQNIITLATDKNQLILKHSNFFNV